MDNAENQVGHRVVTVAFLMTGFKKNATLTLASTIVQNHYY